MMLVTGEALQVWGNWKSFDFPLNVIFNLKLILKIKSLKNKYIKS